MKNRENDKCARNREIMKLRNYETEKPRKETSRYHGSCRQRRRQELEEKVIIGAKWRLRSGRDIILEGERQDGAHCCC